MEKEVVGGGKERGRRRKMGVERPERLDGRERGYFLYALFVICDFVTWCPLLAVPEHPGVSEWMDRCWEWTVACMFGLGRLWITGGQGCGEMTAYGGARARLGGGLLLRCDYGLRLRLRLRLRLGLGRETRMAWL